MSLHFLHKSLPDKRNLLAPQEIYTLHVFAKYSTSEEAMI